MLFLLCLILFAAGYILLKLRKKKPSKRKPGQAPDSPEFRVAVHEAGHAIAAWYCTSVTAVESVTLESIHKGFVAYRLNNNHPDVAWCNLVIALSGMAAETHIYQSVRSGPAAQDLTDARRMANYLVSIARTEMPWKVEGDSIVSLPFEKMFKDSLPEEENKLLQDGYCFAKQLLAARNNKHHSLVVQLLKHRNLTEQQLYPILGDRIFIKALGLFRPNFV